MWSIDDVVLIYYYYYVIYLENMHTFVGQTGEVVFNEVPHFKNYNQHHG